MRTILGVAGTLLPFVVLFSAFLIFKLDAFRASLSAWIVELVLVLVFYRMPFLKSLEASVWGNLAMWTGFLVLYTGQLFGQAYRNTGLLEILLESIQSMLPSWDGKGGRWRWLRSSRGFIGAFNGFATYPVTIPGLVDIGFDGVQATTSYLVYFSWTLPFNSLFHRAEYFQCGEPRAGRGYRARGGTVAHSAGFAFSARFSENSGISLL